jgi:2-C-methyl-D-erythritol 2,4-cyclodiphosphate synthase
VKIPFPKGLDGHSDADVLVHAVCDALLGALAQGDIGIHFPATSEEYKDISSLRLLTQVMKLVEERGFQVGNLDTTIIAQAPQLNPYFDLIKNTLAPIIGLEAGQINIKAKSPEGLGPIGCGEGIAAFAIALLFKKDE